LRAFTDLLAPSTPHLDFVDDLVHAEHAPNVELHLVPPLFGAHVPTSILALSWFALSQIKPHNRWAKVRPDPGQVCVEPIALDPQGEIGRRIRDSKH
jgi:hypothetical protein